MCNYDCTVLSRFVEYLSRVALRFPTDQELREFASVLDLSALEVPAEQQLDSVRRISEISAANLDRNVEALPSATNSGPSVFL